MRRFLTTILLTAGLLALAVTGFAACDDPEPTRTPVPTPTPTAQPVERLYLYFQEQKELNPVRFEQMLDDRGLYGFTGIISEIDGSTVHFLVFQRFMRKDETVECNFEDKDDVLSLNVGEVVTMYGNLVKAKRVVRLKDCRQQSPDRPKRR